MSLRTNLIRLAHSNKSLRPHLLPLLKRAYTVEEWYEENSRAPKFSPPLTYGEAVAVHYHFDWIQEEEELVGTDPDNVIEDAVDALREVGVRMIRKSTGKRVREEDIDVAKVFADLIQY